MSSALREEVLAHLWRRYPQHCVILADPRTRRAIDVGIERAARHGFRQARDVRSYVSLMLFLGSHFDDDPQLPWAGERLRRSAGISRTDVMVALLTETSQRLLPVVGAQGEHYRLALGWAMARSFDDIASTYRDTDDGLRAFLRQLHRRKYESLGAAAIAELILDARRVAARHGLTTPPGVVVCLALMFLLGCGFDRDPFHPWAAQTLALYSDAEPTAAARALHASAIEILHRFTRLDQLMRAQQEGRA